LDGQTLTARNDDNEQAIEERLDTYERETSPVLEYYRTTPAAMLDVDWQPGTAGAGVGTDLPVAEKPMIVRKTASELEKMRQAGLLVWRILQKMKEMAAPGITTLELENRRREDDLRCRRQTGVQRLLTCRRPAKRLSLCCAPR